MIKILGISLGGSSRSARKRLPRSDDSMEDFEAVGESHYQNELWKIIGKPKTKYEPEWQGAAELVAEKSNSHDPNAVRVVIQGKTVGYLDRDTAAMVHAALLRRGPKTVRCSSTGGFTRKNGERTSLGIVLTFNPDRI
jgi:hypothetical protein